MAIQRVPRFPGYRGRVTFLARDWRELQVRIPLSWRTRNYVGTIFGGSMYGALDPWCMVMLIQLLGPDYEVLDKAAAIRFRRPGRGTLHATFRIDEEATVAIRAGVAEGGRMDWTFDAELVGENGVVHARCHKVIHVRRR